MQQPGADALRNHGKRARPPRRWFSVWGAAFLQERIALHGLDPPLSRRAGLGHVLLLDVSLRRGMVKQMFPRVPWDRQRGATSSFRQDKLSSKEKEGILHEVHIFPCHLQEQCLMQLPLTNPNTLFGVPGATAG